MENREYYEVVHKLPGIPVNDHTITTNPALAFEMLQYVKSHHFASGTKILKGTWSYNDAGQFTNQKTPLKEKQLEGIAKEYNIKKLIGGLKQLEAIKTKQ